MLKKIIHLKCLILFTKTFILNLSFFYLIQFCEINFYIQSIIPYFLAAFFFLSKRKKTRLDGPKK